MRIVQALHTVFSGSYKEYKDNSLDNFEGRMKVFHMQAIILER